MVVAHRIGSSESVVSLEEEDYDVVRKHDAIQNEPTTTHEMALAAVGPHAPRRDKAAQLLGVPHKRSMEPVPRSSLSATTPRSATMPTRSPPQPPHTPSSTLASLYVVSGLPKSPHTWNLADNDSTVGLHHSEGAVSRFWRAEVLGHTVSAGVGGRRKKRGGAPEVKGPGALSKQEVGKMLSKTLKLSFTREVEIIASTLQPPSTVHSFTFTTPNSSSSSSPFIRGSLLTDNRISNYSQSASVLPYSHGADPFAAPTSSMTYLGPKSAEGPQMQAKETSLSTWYGVCLTVWSHADAERSAAIRRTLEAAHNSRTRTESAHSVTSAKLRSLRAERKRRGQTLQVNHDTTEAETDAEGISESEYETASVKGPGHSTLFLPGDTVFWLPYALTLVSKHPIYDLMRDYLTLSWARFSKDVAAHTLQISKILACPAPRAGDIIRLDASAKDDEGQNSLEIVARFPGALDFGKGLIDINFTMWPLFKALSLDNIITICEIAMAPTGRVLFLSRYPAMLGIAVSTLKYIVELRGWSGLAYSAAHCRDARIYVDDPGPWIIGLNTEARYTIRPSAEVCVCDIDINYVNCPTPPTNCVSARQQREKFKERLAAAFDGYYHPDQSIPSEFKEAFPAGRFRPLCKIQAKRGVSNSSAAVISEMIRAPEWWNGPKVIQAIDSILKEKLKKPSFFARLTGAARAMPKLTLAEVNVQQSIRKRASAFVDARDDLETKIGRLSRRLNFLVTESDLWREKFITFEQYAEKLSTEATDLRARINREQRESKRLSGLISATAHEKQRLEKKLHDTESAHAAAVEELDVMRMEMERMEEEREQMVAEVEAQIERALASMTIEDDDEMINSQGGGSRPLSPRFSLHSQRNLRSRSAPGSRRQSFSGGFDQRPGVRGSFATDTTVVEPPVPPLDRNLLNRRLSVKDKTPSPGENDTEKTSIGTGNDDGLDAGISEKSDKIAQKVFQIQQKLEMALGADVHHRYVRSSDSESDAPSQRSRRSRIRTPQVLKLEAPKIARNRSLSPTPESPKDAAPAPPVEEPGTPTLLSAVTPSTSTSTVQQPMTPGMTTDESDADFQSAYGGSVDDHGDSAAEYVVPFKLTRPRVPSNATARRLKVQIKTSNSTIGEAAKAFNRANAAPMSA